MIEELNRFLDGPRNSKHAIAWYNQFGDNDSLKLLAKQFPESAFVRTQLIQAIVELKEKAAAISQKPKKVEKAANIDIPQKDAGVILNQLDKRKGALFREASVLHSHLHHMNYAELQQAVPVIVQNMAEVDRIWIIKNNYEKTGQLPKELTNRYSLKDYVNRLKSLPTYISKLKKEIESIDENDVQLQKKEKRLAEFEAEKDRLEMILNNSDVVIQS